MRGRKKMKNNNKEDNQKHIVNQHEKQNQKLVKLIGLPKNIHVQHVSE